MSIGKNGPSWPPAASRPRGRPPLDLHRPISSRRPARSWRGREEDVGDDALQPAAAKREAMTRAGRASRRSIGPALSNQPLHRAAAPTIATVRTRLSSSTCPAPINRPAIPSGAPSADRADRPTLHVKPGERVLRTVRKGLDMLFSRKRAAGAASEDSLAAMMIGGCGRLDRLGIEQAMQR